MLQNITLSQIIEKTSNYAHGENWNLISENNSKDNHDLHHMVE